MYIRARRALGVYSRINFYVTGAMSMISNCILNGYISIFIYLRLLILNQIPIANGEELNHHYPTKKWKKKKKKKKKKEIKKEVNLQI